MEFTATVKLHGNSATGFDVPGAGAESFNCGNRVSFSSQRDHVLALESAN